MHFHEGLHDFEPFLAPFDLFFITVFEPFLTLSRAMQGHFRTKIGPFLGRFGVISGSLRDHFGIILPSFLGAVLTRF